MKKLWIIALFALVATVGCKKGDLNFNNSSGAAPAVPVTVSNAAYFTNGLPTVTTSLSGGGTVTIKLEIPSSSGRTIKEISRVALGTSTANYKVVETTTGLYNTAPIPGSGTSATFTTTMAAFATFIAPATSITTGGTATSFLPRYFYFLITLDDGTTVIPVPVRVYVNT